MEEIKKVKFNKLDYTYKVMMIATLTIIGLVVARDIVIPILFAGIISVVSLPLVKRLERKMPSALAISLILLGTLVVFFFGGWIIVRQVTALVSDLPDLESKFATLITNINTFVEGSFSITAEEQTQMLKEGLSNLSSYATELVTATTHIISLFVEIPIYIFLFLIYRDRFKAFFIKIIPNSEEMTWKKDMENVIQGYISGLMLVTLIIATLNSIGLLALGIKHAIFFGILSGLLTIIPYVGIFIAALLPVILALLTKDSAWYAIGVIGLFSVVQFLEGNFVTPRITGSKVSINALAAVVALLIGGKILGIAGMILAVPCLGIFKILLSHSKHLKPFVILIEDTPLPKKATEIHK